MHRTVRENIESVLAEERRAEVQDSASLAEQSHLDECGECREEIAAMREQAAAIRLLRAPAEIEPRAGFYARVMERIEAQTPVSIWTLFFDSVLARRIAAAAVAFTLLAGAYLVSSERAAERATPITVGTDWVLSGAMPEPADSPDREAVLVNLVTYREQ
jgi:predicted anti-sigma-YlaC factor YlaD